MSTLSYKAIDVDNHYYEPIDCVHPASGQEVPRRGVQMFATASTPMR